LCVGDWTYGKEVVDSIMPIDKGDILHQILSDPGQVPEYLVSIESDLCMDEPESPVSSYLTPRNH